MKEMAQIFFHQKRFMKSLRHTHMDMCGLVWELYSGSKVSFPLVIFREQSDEVHFWGPGVPKNKMKYFAY